MALTAPTVSTLTPEEIGQNVSDRAYSTAMAIRAHWLAAFQDFFGQPGFTVADLQRMTDSNNGMLLLLAHRDLQAVLRASLPVGVMADDPVTTPIAYTVEYLAGFDPTNPDPSLMRIVWDATARYPTEPISEEDEDE